MTTKTRSPTVALLAYHLRQAEEKVAALERALELCAQPEGDCAACQFLGHAGCAAPECARDGWYCADWRATF